MSSAVASVRGFDGRVARRCWLVWVLAVVLLVSACGGGATGASGSSAPTIGSPTVAGPSAGRGWGLPADASAAAASAGLPMLGQEMLAVHYHAHLDVMVDGKPVVVPAGLGIDPARQRISPLHTHDATGVVHIESASDIPFTLGQLFAEWGQPLTASQVGPRMVAAGEVVRVYRNGTLVAGEPGGLRFAQHDEIEVWVGPAATTPSVPATFAFPSGL